jgi:hypothetical protein
MAVPIIPRVIRGRLYFETADVSFPTFAQAATASAAAEAHRLDIAEPLLRRCKDCRLDLSRDVLRALGTCPRWGKQRHGVESRCPAFVAKDGAR